MHKAVLIFAVLLLLAASLPDISSPANVSYPMNSVTIYADADATVRQDVPNANYGHSVELQVMDTQGSLPSIRNVGWILVHFDMSAVPANAYIWSARIEMDATVCEGTARVEVRQVTDRWTETSVTWNTMPTYGSNLYVSAAPDCGSGRTVWSLPTWIMQSTSNHGFLLKGLEAATYNYGFISREEQERDNLRPRLVIEYYIPTATSTPSQTPTRAVTEIYTYLPLQVR